MLKLELNDNTLEQLYLILKASLQTLDVVETQLFGVLASVWAGSCHQWLNDVNGITWSLHVHITTCLPCGRIRSDHVMHVGSHVSQDHCVSIRSHDHLCIIYDYLLEHTATPIPSSLQRLMEAKMGGATTVSRTTLNLLSRNWIWEHYQFQVPLNEE